MMDKKLDFEERIKMVKEIVDKIQNSQVSLDESLKLYEDGIKIIKDLTKELKEEQEKIEKIIEID